MKKRQLHMIRGGFDAASMSLDAQRHWRHADSYSPDVAMAPDIRRRIVSRSRYEAANNSWLRGLIDRMAGDTIGTGVRLQLTLKDREAAKRREMRFHLWAKKIKLAKKLRIARIARIEAGEVFILKTHNPKLSTPNKMDLILYEAEQVASPMTSLTLQYHDTGVPKEYDGILFDSYGNPEKYRFQSVHPGSKSGEYLYDSKPVDARRVIHYYHEYRPGQHRGIPETIAALSIFSDLRRYTEAVIAAAETAAAISFLLKTNTPPEENDDPRNEHEPPIRFMDVVEFVRNQGVALPEGWEAQQLKAEQPVTNFPEFEDSRLNAAASGFGVPFNVAKCNSNKASYASSRQDFQQYYRTLKVARGDIENDVLDNILEDWEAEDRIYFPEDYLSEARALPAWFFPGFEHVDPSKESTAQDKKLHNHTTNLAAEYAKEGKDWESELEQSARERERMRELGLENKPSSTDADNDNDDEEKEEKDDADEDI